MQGCVAESAIHHVRKHRKTLMEARMTKINTVLLNSLLARADARFGANKMHNVELPLASCQLRDSLTLIESLIKANRPDQLEAAIAQVRARFCKDADALKDLALLLNRSDYFKEALDVARQGLALDPDHPLLHHNAARALSIRGDPASSRHHGEEATRLLPDVPQLKFQLAGTLLALGEFDEGWRRYRAFHDIPENAKDLVRPPYPEWSGQSVEGCRFLMVGEQGRGDEIQCLRFADWLHRQGAIVDVLVSRPVAELARSMKSISTVHVHLPSVHYDFWSYMLRMPGHMKLDLTMLPGRVPYVCPPPQSVIHWRKILEAVSPRIAGERRVGIVWAGSPYHVLDRFRSIELGNMKPIFSLPGLTWFSVQKGERERETESLGDDFDVYTLGPQIEDFSDTLAILHSLDLLITVDTSVAHLAGAAGLPVWTLVPAYTEWRWLTDRTDSPWYPSMRLFRQRDLGDWTAVIEEVRDALCDWSETPHSRTS
jgi:tetratricopeptide (TPR) repeat protein